MLNLGPTEIILIVLVVLMVVGGPVAVIAVVIYFVIRKEKSNAHVKKCAFCGYSIPVETAVCQVCGRDLVTSKG